MLLEFRDTKTEDTTAMADEDKDFASPTIQRRPSQCAEEPPTEDSIPDSANAPPEMPAGGVKKENPLSKMFDKLSSAASAVAGTAAKDGDAADERPRGTSFGKRHFPSYTSHKIRIVYFAVRAKDQAAKMALAYGKIPFDEVLPADYFGKPWAEAKAEATFSQLPLLVVDDTVIAQSVTILRFCARLAGLVPANPLAEARADQACNAAEELGIVNPLVNMFTMEKFVDAKKTFFQAFPAKLANLARFLGQGPFFAGKYPSYGDLNVYHHLDNARLLEPGCLDEHPNIITLMRAVENLQGVKSFLAARRACEGIGVAPMLAAPAAPPSPAASSPKPAGDDAPKEAEGEAPKPAEAEAEAEAPKAEAPKADASGLSAEAKAS